MRLVLAIGCFALVAGLYGSSAFSTTVKKNYTVGLCSPPGAGCVSNPTVNAGPNTFVVTLTNDGSSTQSLGSANVTFPTPPFQAGSLAVVQNTITAAGGGKTWTADTDPAAPNTLRLRNPGPNTTNALAPGESVSVQVTATVTADSCTAYKLTSIAKQANDFSGQPGNNFVNLTPTLPTVQVLGAGPLDHFTVGAIGSPQTAGSPFQVTATAYNTCGNVMTSYAGGATPSIQSSNAVSTTSPGFPPAVAGTPPSYGVPTGFGAWTNGTATVNAPGVISFAATSFNANTSSYNADFFVKVADGAKTGSSNNFAVQPASAYKLTFVQQPTLTATGAAITPAVQVKVQDQYGNVIPGAPVSVSLNTDSGTGALSGTTTQAAGSSGIATFADLSVDKSGIYSLTATSGAANATSNGFLVSDVLATCHGNSCVGSLPVQGNSTLSVSATGTSNGNTLAIALFGNDSPPAGVCAGFTPDTGLGGSFVQVSGASSPSLTITWDIDKSIVNQQSDNGAAHYNVCLGSVNLQHPDGTNVTPWTQKDGTPAVAVPDAFLGATLFWGLLPDEPNGVKSCSSPQASSGPAILSRSKTGSGDVVVTFCVPYPWDPHGFSG